MMLQRSSERSLSAAASLLAVVLVLQGQLRAAGSFCDMDSEIGSAISPLGAPPLVVPAADQVVGFEVATVTLTFCLLADPPVRTQGLRWFYSRTRDSTCCEGLEEITNLTSRNHVSELMFLGPDDGRDALALLIISNLTFGGRLIGSDTGRYFLMAASPIGSHYAYTDLSIYGMPRITSPPQDATVINTASSVSFQCSVFALPNHTTKWIFTSFSGDSTFINTAERSDKYAITMTRLTVFDVKFEDRGVYNCSTFNSLGQDSASAVLVFHVPPGPVQNIRVTSVPPNSILLQWELPAFTTGPISTYRLTLSDVNGTTLVNTTQLESRTTLTNLMPLVPYTMTVSAINIAGEGESTLTQGFSQEGIPSVSPNDVAGRRLNGSHFTVSWSPLSLEEARGFVTLYTVSYQPTTGQSKRLGMSVTAQSDESSVVIGGLSVSQAYSVSVSGSTSVGMGPMSSSVTVPTLPSEVIQVVLIQAQDCNEWVSIDLMIKEDEMTMILAEVIEQQCRCGFSSEHISEQGFQCLGDSDHITFRARIYEVTAASTSQLTAIVEEWTRSGPDISIQGVHFSIRASCPVVVTSVNDPGCMVSNSNFNTPVIALEAGAIGSCVILLLALAAGVIIVSVYYQEKRKNNSKAEETPSTVVLQNALARRLSSCTQYELQTEDIPSTRACASIQQDEQMIGISPIYYELHHPTATDNITSLSPILESSETYCNASADHDLASESPSPETASHAEDSDDLPCAAVLEELESGHLRDLGLGGRHCSLSYQSQQNAPAGAPQNVRAQSL